MRFNTRVQDANRVDNLAGGQAFAQDTRLELVSLLLTSFVQDQYYRSADNQIARLRELVSALSDKRFAAKAAIYARNEFGMRSISHAVAGELAIQCSGTGTPWLSDFLNQVVRRPDDVTEITAYYFANANPPGVETNAMRRGLGAALARFDEYQLAKYNRKAQYSLVDCVNMYHPPHTPALEKLVNGTLESPDTWEAKLTQAGQNAESDEDKADRKREVWTELVLSGKISYFALLRNLRNILEQAPNVMGNALEILTDENRIRKSLVLPFRYLTAIEQLQVVPGSRNAIAALSDALDISLANVPRFDGNTLVVVDVSGSMSGLPMEIASVFASILFKSNDAHLMIFDNHARYLELNFTDSTLSLAQSIARHATWGGTDFSAPFHAMKYAYNRIIFLSDMQGWIGYYAPTSDLARYEQEFGVRPHVYSFDLQGYSSMQFPQDRLYCLAGFSDKVFDIMSLLEQDRHALVNKIESIQL